MGRPLVYPAGTGKAGRELLRGLRGEFRYDARENTLAETAARLADEIDVMETAARGLDSPLAKGSRGQPVVHPLYEELRRHRRELAEMLDRLEPPPEAAGKRRPSIVDPRLYRRAVNDG
jgi:hypothetical protein